MKIAKKQFILYFMLTIVLSIIAIVGRIVLMVSYIEPDTGLYLANTNAPLFYNIFIGICILVFVTSLLFIKCDKNEIVSLPDTIQPIVFSSSLCGFMLLASIILQIIYYVNGTQTTSLSNTFKIIMLIVSVPAALFFFVTASSSKVSPNRLTILSFFPIIWSAFFLMNIYFDNSTSINSPTRIITQLALIFIMLYFLYETRFLMKRPKLKQYFLISFIAILFSSISALPNIILEAFWILPLSTNTIFYAVECGMLIYMVTRLCSFFTKNEHSTKI